MSIIMMACGCASSAVHTAAHDGLTASHPSCVKHQTCAISPDDITAHLSARRARCSYYGVQLKMQRNECNYGQQKHTQCTCEQPSSVQLPFFEYLGPGSRDGALRCTCGYYYVAHLPEWEVRYSVIERTDDYAEATAEVFGRDKNITLPTTQAGTRSQNWPRRVRARNEAEAREESDQIGRDFLKAPSIISVRVDSITLSGKNGIPCKLFVAAGPREFDKFYCGCMSWD